MYVLILLALILTTATLLETPEPECGYRDLFWCWTQDMIPPTRAE